MKRIFALVALTFVTGTAFAQDKIESCARSPENMTFDSKLANADGSTTYVMPKILRDGEYLHIGTVGDKGRDLTTGEGVAFCLSLKLNYQRSESAVARPLNELAIPVVLLDAYGNVMPAAKVSAKVLSKVNCK